MNNIRLCFTSGKTVAFSKYILSKTDYFGGIRTFSVGSQKNMKLVQFVYNNCPNEIRAGYLDGNNVVDINKVDPSLPSTVLEILRCGHLEQVKCLPAKKPVSLPLCDVELAAPVIGMDKVMCIGLNYQDHCEEQNLVPPKVPLIFSKFSSSVIGPRDPLRLRTSVTQKVDWEVELVVVIGKTASNVCPANAYEYVAGYTVAQDISARDWQKERNGGQFLLGKSMDTFCPIGPCITTTDEIPDPQVLDIRCCVNGDLKQSRNTNQLVHKIPDVIARLSSVMTLYPGDILLTGTPGGVGMYRNPPEYLQPGDVIVSEIQGIGVLETRVVNFC